jgi:hypothetical protein
MKALSTIPLIIFNITLALGQNFDIPNLENKNNMNSLNLHWATAKLCKGFYAEKDILTELQNQSTFKLPGGQIGYGCNVCVELFKNQHQSYFEYFVHRFLNNQRIQKNRTNAFTVRDFQKEIEENHLELYNEYVDAVDTENMVFYKNDVISGNSFDTNELFIKMSYPRIKKIAYGINGNLVNAPFLQQSLGTNGRVMANAGGDLGTIKISMSEEQTQQIYDRYKNHFRPNPPFSIATKLHYAIRMAKEGNGEVRNFEIILKKSEFFLPLEEDIKYIGRRAV